VYLLRVVVPNPNAKIPTVEFPAADPASELQLDAAPDDTTHPEYVYLSRVVEAYDPANPKAKIANVPSAIGVALPLAALNAEGPKALQARTVNVYAVQAVNPLTVTGEAVPVPVIDPGEDTAV